MLANAGIELVDDAPADVDVLLLTSELLKDPRIAGSDVAPHRLVVLLEHVDPAWAPPDLAQINWLPWDPSAVNDTLGRLLSSVVTKPGEWQQHRVLLGRATDWGASGRARSLLLTSSRQVRRLRASRVVASGPYAALLSDFLAQSAKAIRRRRVARVVATTMACLVVLVLVSGLLVSVAALRQQGRNNRQLFITANSDVVRLDLPDWSALLASSLMLNGSAQVRSAARPTLLAALNEVWTGGPIEAQCPGCSVEAVLPSDGDSDAVLVVATDDDSRLVGYDQRAAHFTWQVELGGPIVASLSPSGRTVAVGGAGRIVFVDLATRRVAATDEVPGQITLPVGVVALSDTSAMLLNNDGTTWLDRAGRISAGPHIPGTLVAANDTGRGAPAILTTDDHGGYTLLSLPAGTEVASGHVPEPVLSGGGVSASGTEAFVLGGDHQLWQLTASGAVPTGIATNDRDTVISALPNGVIVVGGTSTFVHAYTVDTHLDLGVVCRKIPQLMRITSSPNGSMLGCMGTQFLDFWPGPVTPVSAPSPLPAQLASDPAAGITTTVTGSTIEIQLDRNGQRSRLKPPPIGAAPITSVGLSPDRTQLAVGTQSGQYDVFALQEAPQLVAHGSLPSATPVRGFVWADGNQLQVVDEEGAWPVWSCSGCGTDAGLLAAAKRRLAHSGCWEPRQFLGVDERTQRLLGVHLCAPLPEAG